MIDLRDIFGSSLRAAAALALLTLGLGGCANLGDSFASGAFADPARYQLYDCKQLEAERKNLITRTAELQGLIDKANTGAGGALVAEAVYRNDYISTRAQAKLAEEALRDNKCATAGPGPAGAPSRPSFSSAPPANAVGSRSGRAVY